jgi:imidazolonepropionase-like amidohydrolase
MQGHPAHVPLRDRVARGELAGPTILAGSPPVHGKNAPDAAAAGALVADHKKSGFDLLKVWEGLSPDAYAGLMDAARAAGLPVAGHVTATVGLDRALAARQASIEHLDGYLQALVRKDAPVPAPASQVVLGPVLQHIDESRMKELAVRTREAGVYNTPTLELFKIVVSQEPPETFLAWPEMRYISPALRAQFAKQKAGTAGIQAPAGERQRYVDLRNRMTKALAAAGAGLLIGPDSPQMFLVPGFATHREIRGFVEAGLSPYQALTAATRGPADYLGQAEQFGTVAVGRRADLLLLEGNPLTDVSNLEKRSGVMVRGRWLDRAALTTMLDQIAALYVEKP